jgi:ATP-dependent Clp protease ATP-binding subunit ClpA
MIPEFVGRLPVVVPMRSLTRAEILNVMTEPKNALVKQYKAMFEIDGCQLEFTDDALEELADRGHAARDRRALAALDVRAGAARPALRHRPRKGERIVITWPSSSANAWLAASRGREASAASARRPEPAGVRPPRHSADDRRR